MAVITWGLVSWLHLGRPSVLGLISGGIAGLAAVTPAAGYVDTRGAIIIGLAAGILCYCGILVRKRFKREGLLEETPREDAPANKDEKRAEKKERTKRPTKGERKGMG